MGWEAEQRWELGRTRKLVGRGQVKTRLGGKVSSDDSMIRAVNFGRFRVHTRSELTAIFQAQSKKRKSR